jgi:hypothetical protein
LTRKHHCRSCGRLVCGNCSPNKSVVREPAKKTADEAPQPATTRAVRVCNLCG